MSDLGRDVVARSRIANDEDFLAGVVCWATIKLRVRCPFRVLTQIIVEAIDSGNLELSAGDRN